MTTQEVKEILNEARTASMSQTKSAIIAAQISNVRKIHTR